MRAVVCHEIGPVENLVLESREPLEAGAGQLVVDVRAVGVNYVDALFVRGEYQIKPATPFTPGNEVAGEVTAVGDGVEGWSVGDRVLAMTGLGGYAGQVAVQARQLTRLPDAMTFATAAAFPQSYCTALFSLDRRAGLHAGETVLVLGAAGGVGRACIDVAKAIGARVIAAASSAERLELCRAAGADEVIDYSTEDLKVRSRELSGGGVDVVVDPVGGDKSEDALRALAYDGRLLVIGFARGEIPRLPLNQVLLRNRRIVGVDWGAWMLANPAEQQQLLDDLFAMVENGRIHPPEPTPYPLDRVADALGDLLAGRAVGKLVLEP